MCQEEHTNKFKDCRVYGGKSVDRIIWERTSIFKQDEQDVSITFKDKEIITFNKGKNTSKLSKSRAVCIGFNPAKSEEEVDTTNKRLIKMLWDDYDGYTLLNLYPQVTPKADQCDLSLTENQESVKRIAQTIRETHETVILFWGRSACLDDEIKQALVERVGSELPTKITVSKNRDKKNEDDKEELFTHPGAINGTYLLEFDNNRIEPSYRIV